ncbi:hypothetical protein Bca101_075999 [Brassica carinata]
MAKSSFSTSKSSSQDINSSYKVKSNRFLPKLYGDYGFWNPSPVYGGGFPYPGPVPHGSLARKNNHCLERAITTNTAALSNPKSYRQKHQHTPIPMTKHAFEQRATPENSR